MHLAEQIAMFETVKAACSKVASNLCSKLSYRFLDVKSHGCSWHGVLAILDM